jgi:hypothetical protein
MCVEYKFWPKFYEVCVTNLQLLNSYDASELYGCQRFQVGTWIMSQTTFIFHDVDQFKLYVKFSPFLHLIKFFVSLN